MAAASNNAANLEMARGKIDESREAIDGLRKGLVSFTEENAHRWRGETAQTFRQVIAAADEKLTKTLEALNDLGEKVGLSAKSYANNESSQQQAMSKFDNLLNF